MENFEDKQSKYGKIYKVAGPRKYSQGVGPFFLPRAALSFHESQSSTQFINFNLFFDHSRCGRKYVRIKNVRACQDRMGQVGR